jgi:hypothetical protein
MYEAKLGGFLQRGPRLGSGNVMEPASERWQKEA